MKIEKQAQADVVHFDCYGFFEVVDPNLLNQISGGNSYEPEFCGLGCRCTSNNHVKCSGAGGVAVME